MYWRCSANSVEKPVNGERCKPDMNPSTTVRASNSSEEIRASTSGARNLGAPEYACADCKFDCSLISVFLSLRQFIFISGLFHISYEIWDRALVHQQNPQLNPDLGSGTVSTSFLVT